VNFSFGCHPQVGFAGEQHGSDLSRVAVAKGQGHALMAGRELTDDVRQDIPSLGM